MRKTATLFILAAIVAGTAQAQLLSSAPFTLEQTLEISLKNNPEILAAARRLEAAKNRKIQAFTPDKPKLNIERMYTPSGSDLINGAPEKNLSVSQEIPFPTTLYLKGRIAEKEAEAAEQEYISAVRRISAETRTAYAMLFLAHKALSLLDENTGIMKRFAKVAEAKYSVGRASQSDVLKAQVELSKMLNMLVTLAQEKETAIAMLNVLMNLPPESPLPRPIEPEIKKTGKSLEEIQAAALDENPEIRSAAINAEKGDKSVALARSEYLPDIMLLYRERDSAMTTPARTRDAMAGFSFPLWFWKQSAALKEAKAGRETARAELQAAKNTISYSVKNLFVKVQTSYRLLELYRTSVIPQAEEALKIAEIGYQSEKTDFMDLLDAERSLLNFRLEYYQYIADYEKWSAELERVAGKI